MPHVTHLTVMRMFKWVSGDLEGKWIALVVSVLVCVCVCVCVFNYEKTLSLLCKCILYYVCVYPLGPFRTDGAVQTLR